MKDALRKALEEPVDASVERILAATFFRSRPRASGALAEVVCLADRRARSSN